MATTAECLGSYILDFHIYWSKASVKSKKQRKEENRWGLFLCLWSFPKQICFVWLLGHIFPDILLCEFEDVAAKWFFTLVIISVVKHCSFFPSSLGKFIYQIASLLVLLDNKINSCYWVVTLLLFTLNPGACRRVIFFLEIEHLLLQFLGFILLAPSLIPGSILCWFKILISSGGVKLSEFISP